MSGGRPLRKYIYDPVHGGISLTGPALDLIGHPFVQRLWGIRQTGLAHLVFPGASHTRLEHSLGVLGVTRAMCRGLELDPAESLLLEVAGFLHDLGHTAFSHTLEPVLEEGLGLSHEGITQRMIRGDPPEAWERWRSALPGKPAPSIPEVLERHGLRAQDVAAVLGTSRPLGRPYLAEALHGAIDADRLDYLQRDAHYTGVAHGVIDANRLLETLRLQGGHLVFAEKARPAVEGFLVARSLMYSAVYYNKTVRIAEVMLQSALERLDGPRSELADLLGRTDAELLVALETLGDRPAEIARRLKLRQLYKRAAFRPWEAEGSSGPALARLARDPARRREVEDLLAERLDLPPGEALLDLALTHHGMAPSMPGHPRDRVRIVEGPRVVDLLAANAQWAPLVTRPPTPWSVALYGPPRHRQTLATRGLRLLDRLL